MAIRVVPKVEGLGLGTVHNGVMSRKSDVTSETVANILLAPTLINDVSSTFRFVSFVFVFELKHGVRICRYFELNKNSK